MNYGMRLVTLYRRQGSRPSPWKRNAKVGSQETPGVTGKFGLGIQNEPGQRLRPGADCGSDHELLNTKFRLKLKKAGKTARPFR